MPTVAEIFHSLLAGPPPTDTGNPPGSAPPSLVLPTLTSEELHVLQPGGGALRGRSNHSALLSSVAPSVGGAVEAAVARSLIARGLISSVQGVASRRRSEPKIEAELGPELQMILEVRRSPISIAVLDSVTALAPEDEPGWSSILYGMLTQVEGQPVRALMEERISPDLFHTFTVRGFPEAVAAALAAVDRQQPVEPRNTEIRLPGADGSWAEVEEMLSAATKVSRVEATFPGSTGPCLIRSGIAIGLDYRLLIVGTRRGEVTSLSASEVSSEELHSHLWGVLAGDESIIDRFESTAG